MDDRDPTTFEYHCEDCSVTTYKDAAGGKLGCICEDGCTCDKDAPGFFRCGCGYADEKALKMHVWKILAGRRSYMGTFADLCGMAR